MRPGLPLVISSPAKNRQSRWSKVERGVDCAKELAHVGILYCQAPAARMERTDSAPVSGGIRGWRCDARRFRKFIAFSRLFADFRLFGLLSVSLLVVMP